MCPLVVPSVLEPKLDPRRLQNVSIGSSIGIGTRARSKEVPKRYPLVVPLPLEPHLGSMHPSTLHDVSPAVKSAVEPFLAP